jgi:hypothetical protein
MKLQAVSLQYMHLHNVQITGYLESHEMIQLNDVRILVTLHSMHILLSGYILIATPLYLAGLQHLSPGKIGCSPAPGSAEKEMN